jgi:hypothetical protein
VQEIMLSGSLPGAPLLAADVIIHSLRARNAVARAAPPGSRLLELHFVPNPTSVGQVRHAIQQGFGGAPLPSEPDGRALVGAFTK